jgi:hypothetical protein
VRRSEALTVTVLCPHFERPVLATRNEAAGRLVDCRSKEDCVTRERDEEGRERVEYPQGCPVFRRAT